MTAEIVIMNKEAVALAADSAITTIGERGPKIFTSANKIFALSRYYPVGIMVYGAAKFMGVPWETIIKIYRKQLEYKKFNTLKKYADDFIRFLNKENQLFPESEQKEYFERYVYFYFHHIRRHIEEEINKVIMRNKQATQKQIKDITSEVIQLYHTIRKNAEAFSDIPNNFEKNLLGKYNNLIEKVKKEVFEKLVFTSTLSTLLSEIAISLFIKFPKGINTPDRSGVVIAGFGEKDTFPSLTSFFFEGIVNNVLQYKKDKEKDISFDTIATIIPFAQREMVDTFMRGVSPDYEDQIDKYFSKVCTEYPKVIIDKIDKLNKKEKAEFKEKFKRISRDLLKKYRIKFKAYRQDKYVNPVTSVVAMLPKDELAAMAESLVSLTSFKRRVTIEAETVGGPIDVAIISKGDGFIWIKRKHYFKPELNPQFFAKYKKEDKSDERDQKK